MKIGVYCIKDTKTSFWKPHCQINDLSARREFENLVNSDRNDFVAINYKDLELWKLGEFDDATGIIESNVVYICSGKDVKVEVSNG